MGAIRLMLLYLIYKVTETSAVAIWDYDHINDWGKNYPTCGQGIYQSPINIISGRKINAKTDPVIHINSHKSSSAILTNNGKTVQLDFIPGRYKISGGDLPGDYFIDQIHFHWGSKDTQGSEHKIDGVAFPLEMQVVSHSERQTSLHSAVDSGNVAALAVLGFLFQVNDDCDDEDRANPELQPITDKLSSVLSEGSSVTVKNFDLEHLIKDVLKTPLFRYGGSLTTPPCTKIVIWNVFDQKLSLSGEQLDEFRSTGIKDNFRPTQPLKKRKVIQFAKVFPN